MLPRQITSHRMSLCALWVLIAAWNFPSEVILLEHDLLTIPEDKQEHAQSEVKIYMESLIKNNYHY